MTQLMKNYIIIRKLFHAPQCITKKIKIFNLKSAYFFKALA